MLGVNDNVLHTQIIGVQTKKEVNLSKKFHFTCENIILNHIQSLKTNNYDLACMHRDLSFNLIPYMLQKNAKWPYYGHLNDSNMLSQFWKMAPNDRCVHWKCGIVHRLKIAIHSCIAVTFQNWLWVIQVSITSPVCVFLYHIQYQ